MRPPVVVSGLLSVVLAAGVLSALSPDADAAPGSNPTPGPGAPAGPVTPVTPSQAEVDAARAAAGAAGAQVAQVQERLDAAQARADRAAEVASRAAEAYNGALVEVERTRAAEQQAQTAAQAAATALAQQSADYRSAVVASSALGAETSGINAYLEADGMDDLLERTSSDAVVRGLFEARQRAWTEAKTRSDASSAAARRASADAEDALARVTRTKDAAAASAATADGVAAEVAGQRMTLIAEMARLEGVSVELAQRRQDGLAAERAAAARAAAEAAARAEEQRRAAKAAKAAAKAKAEAARTSPTRQVPPATTTRTDSTTPRQAGSPRAGAAAAVAFARAQIGEPYVWAAAGPDAWDCSGLTAAAWAAGGVDLPHWSVAQYDDATPVPLAQLAPGDLVFWSDGGPAGIYHVALYVGDGRIVHAPRTGRPVVEESMFYWRTPDFYARP